MRWPCLICILILGAGASAKDYSPKQHSGKSEPKPIQRTLELAFGTMIDADGNRVTLPHISIPVTLVPVDARTIKNKPYKHKGLSGPRRSALGDFINQVNGGLLASLNPAPRPLFTDTPVYTADTGEPYYYVDPTEFEDPSSLDGITMVNGANAPWTGWKLGFHNEASTPKVLFRFLAYRTYDPGAPAGTSAFSNWFCDLGFYINNVPAGTYRMEGSGGAPLDVSSLGITSPNNTFYWALQWREPQTPEQGEGPFNTNFYNLYSIAAPSLGSSADNYWYDWDPLDGIYANEELEVLGDGAGTTYPSNFFFRLWANVGGGSQTDEVTPFAFRFITGRDQTGDITSVLDSDDQYATLTPAPVLNGGQAPMSVEAEGVAPTTGASTFRFKYEVGTTTAGSPVKVYLWNYTTGVYDLLDSTTSTSTDTTRTITVTATPTKYVSSTNKHVKSLVTWGKIPTLSNGWKARIDWTHWSITR